MNERKKKVLALDSILSGEGISTVTYQPDNTTGQDTYVDSATPDGDFSSSVNLRLSTIRFGLIKFPISITGTILSGTLSLWVQSVGTGTSVVTARRVLDANSTWTEASTWNYKTPSTVRWAGDAGGDGGADAGCSVNGTDISSVVLGTATYTASDPTGTQLDFTLNAAELALMVASNNGIHLKGSVANTFNVHSCESVTAAFRPRLTIRYRP